MSNEAMIFSIDYFHLQPMLHPTVAASGRHDVQLLRGETEKLPLGESGLNLGITAAYFFAIVLYQLQ